MWNLPGYTDNASSLEWQRMAELYPWVKDMIGIEQDPVHHAEGDVFVHTGMVVNALIGLDEFKSLSLQDKRILFAAAMLHDVEKRSTTVMENGRITAPRHAKRGEYTARSIIYKDYPAPLEVREQVCKLVRYHGFPIWSSEKDDYQRKLIACSMDVNTEHLYILAKADMLGRVCGDIDDMMFRLELFKGMCEENECFGMPRGFESDLARYKYLSGEGYVNYVPFDDTKFRVVLLSGLPGAGKDTLIKREYPDMPVVSIDEIRRNIGAYPGDESGNGQAIQAAKEQAKKYMRKKESFVWNATNVTRDMRSRQIDLFTSYGAWVDIVYVETSYKNLMLQNSSREYVVPTKVIDRLINKLEMPGLSEAHTVKYLVH